MPTEPIPIGSLFSGHGGLDHAVTEVTGRSVAWHCENDPAATAVLAHHHPDVPNLGDITTVDWTRVPPVSILTGGFPCTDISSAGRQAGLRHDTRSGLWFHMARAISALQPPIVVIENVRNLLSANADGNVEPCPWCVGNRAEDCVRALGTVLADLADLGYDAAWCGLRASDVGAPHARFRIFIAAADTHSPRPQRTEPTRGRHLPARRPAADPDHIGPVRAGTTRRRRTGPAHNGAESAAHTDRQAERHQRDSRPAPAESPEPETDRRVGRSDRAPAADPESQRWDQRRAEHAGQQGRPGAAVGSDGDGGTHAVDWNRYEPAVRRWETILGRAAPTPTVAGRRGGRQLNPRFVEWMMGLAPGHVTDIPGLSRNDMLRLLGNGVVPRQGVAALQWLLPQLTGDVTVCQPTDSNAA